MALAQTAPAGRLPLREEEQALPAASPLERTIATILLAALLLFSTALVSLKVGTLPIRGFVSVGLLGLAIVVYPQRTGAAVRQHALVLVLAALLAVLGSFVSFVNGAPFAPVLRMVLEVHVQVSVTVILATVLCGIAGAQRSAATFVAVIGLSVVVGLLQLAGFTPAWAVKAYLRSIQFDSSLNEGLGGARPSGIAYSPIQLSTHICLAFAVFASVREYVQRQLHGVAVTDLAIIAMLAAMVIGSAITGTRSPILGAAVFFVIYALRRPGSRMLFVLLLGAVVLYIAGPAILELFQSSQPRLVQADDRSATGRQALFTYGWMLFSDNPLGHGFLFDPRAQWPQYWRELHMIPSSDVVQESELHNYVLNMINVYGVGLILALPLAGVLLYRARASLIFFVPYMVHALFHNTGPFWNDILFWYVAGAVSVLSFTTVRPRYAVEDEPFPSRRDRLLASRGVQA